MDRRRTESPVYARQWSGGSSSTGSSSPVSSPAHPKSRLPPAAAGMSTIKRTQNVAAKAAAHRLAEVMKSRNPVDDEDEDDDLGFKFGGPPSLPSTAYSSNVNSNAKVGLLAKPNRSPSPALGRNLMDLNPPVRSTSAGRPSMSIRSQSTVSSGRWSTKAPVAIPPIEHARLEEKRFGPDLGRIHLKDSGNQQEASALRDELEMLQEENEIILDKLRRAEEKREEAEARGRKLEKQVAELGEGVSFDSKLLSRKEAALQKREAALTAAKQLNNGRDEEIASLRAELQNIKDETDSAVEQLREAESEARALRTMTQRMILTHEEMEEVVLKRCWLARYWGLAVRHGICSDISISKHEHWSSLAPLPFEVVISAGQKAREEPCSGDDDSKRSKSLRDLSDLTGEGNIESMLSVEMGLRELASLKVEDAVILAMAQQRRSNLVRQSFSDLSEEESEDILFKEAWLTYFWRRAEVHSVEVDIAEDRLQLWISRNGQSPTPNDAVDVERGLTELRKLGIEQQLWEASRKEIDQPSVADQKVAAESETSS